MVSVRRPTLRMREMGMLLVHAGWCDRVGGVPRASGRTWGGAAAELTGSVGRNAQAGCVFFDSRRKKSCARLACAAISLLECAPAMYRLGFPARLRRPHQSASRTNGVPSRDAMVTVPINKFLERGSHHPRA